MPRRRKSGVQPELFSIRWHHFADPTTPSVDIMSSPDPLNEPTISISSVAPPSSSRRMTRSQRSQRFFSLDDSPRERMFELEVGHQTSPQRLLVTVETEDDDVTMTSGTRRKLFQSPASVRAIQRMEHTTTTTVPLRDSIEDIEDELSYPTTPRRRGRPRKSNGTPIPIAGVKRRADTPIQSSPRRQRVTKSGEEEVEAQPEASIHATPTSARRGRPPKNRVVEPSSELGTAKRDGRRRKAMAPDELVQITEEAAAERSSIYQAAQMSENGMDLVRAPSEMSVDEAAASLLAAVASNGDADSDIWMTTLSDQATPRAVAQPATTNSTRPPPRAPRESVLPESEADMSQGDDYGYLAPAASDSSSAGEPPNELDPQNNDTIAQGEDFSMIFMDSIPSLQASFHGNRSFRSSRSFGNSTFMPTAYDDEELGEQTNLIINNTLETLRQEVAGDETINITEPLEVSQPPVTQQAPVEEVPTPVRPAAAVSPLSASPWWSRKPKKMGSSPLRRQALKSSAKKAENSMMYGLRGEQGEQSSMRDSRQTISAGARNEDSNMYEDSFSEIPQNYLAAATPRRPGLIPTHDDQDEEMEDVHEEVQEEQPEMEQHHEVEDDIEEHHALSHHIATAPTTKRLPTPEKTPPQVEIEENENEEDEIQEEFAQDSPESVRAESPTPPERDRFDVDEDINQISESREQPEVPAETSIKATPINQMSSPLQEPQSLPQESAQEKSARPVLSSIVRAGRVLQSVTSDPPSPGDRENHLGSPFRSSGSKESLQGSKDIHNNRLLNKSPPQPLNFARHQAATSSQAQTNGDRTSLADSNLDVNGSRKAVDRRNKESAEKDPSPSRESAASSLRITPPSDGVMSWVENEGPISPSLRGDNTLKEVSHLSGTRAVKEPIPLGQIDGAGEETDEESQAGDDEMDIWEIEAEREIPKTTRQRPFGGKAAPMYRSTAQSPWARKSMQRSKIAVPDASNKQTKTIGTVTTQSGKAAEVDEFSMLSQKQTEKEAEVASKGNRFDLSTFFSSPAAIPGMLAEKLLPAKTKPIVGSASNRVEPAEPVQAAPVMQTSSRIPRQAPQKEVNPRNGPRTDTFSPVRPNEPEKMQTVERSSSPATPEKIQAPVVAQKQNFTPRPRQTSQTFVQPSSSRAGDTVTPPRMQLSHADIHRWQQETSNASEESPDLRTLLRPLPAKNASPKKSSLRSPLKPRTPGRVVEFTSSVLSPQEQAIVREQRRRANSALSHEQIIPIAPPAPPEPQANNTDNHNTPDVPMSDDPPVIVDESPEPEPLSQTVWSRQHWLFLDALLHLRRQKPFDQDYDRCAEEYLGRTIKSHGEAMILERWHLDCVDAFKAEVGGWDEGILAKRLFALILGEERRRRGMAEQAPRVMFH